LLDDHREKGKFRKNCLGNQNMFYISSPHDQIKMNLLLLFIIYFLLNDKQTLPGNHWKKLLRNFIQTDSREKLENFRASENLWIIEKAS